MDKGFTLSNENTVSFNKAKQQSKSRSGLQKLVDLNKFFARAEQWCNGLVGYVTDFGSSGPYRGILKQYRGVDKSLIRAGRK
jgi:hypothetical protein